MRYLLLIICSAVCLVGFGQSNDSIRVTLREGTNMAIALSPDKKTFVLDLQGTLWTMPVAGGTAKAVTDNLGDCRQPSWSPDGNMIVFQSYRDGGWHLWTITKDGKDLKQITFGIYDNREPQWSADGRRILFSSDRNNNYDIWEIELGSETLTAITHDLKNEARQNSCNWIQNRKRFLISLSQRKTLSLSGRPGFHPRKLFILLMDSSRNGMWQRRKIQSFHLRQPFFFIDHRTPGSNMTLTPLLHGR